MTTGRINQEQHPRREPQEPQLVSAIPFQVPQGAVDKHNTPHETSIKRAVSPVALVSGLASGQSSTEPILRGRADVSADPVRHTTDASYLGSRARGGFGSSYESPVTEALRHANGIRPLRRVPQARIWFVLNDRQSTPNQDQQNTTKREPPETFNLTKRAGPHQPILNVTVHAPPEGAFTPRNEVPSKPDSPP
ncbi:hypothetical protein J7T55_014073 [Diaporthe amygdali]|nr:hypothetical protein J7T55_014073 [Diaporthe amygdali]